MKSREGTVVDADDIMQEMIDTAKTTTEELGKIDDIPVEQRNNLFRTIGLGALKYFILKVDPKKKMLFNPQESIDFNGNTGPFIQYTYARIQAIIRKSALKESEIKQLQIDNYNPVLPEIEVVKIIYDFPSIIAEAGKQYSPSLIANYAYELVKTYNSFYQSVSVFNAETENAKAFRLLLSYQTGECIKNAMYLLGINVPERM
jgi:arginyl-tRNA synthetase